MKNAFDEITDAATKPSCKPEPHWLQPIRRDDIIMFAVAVIGFLAGWFLT